VARVFPMWIPVSAGSRSAPVDSGELVNAAVQLSAHGPGSDLSTPLGLPGSYGEGYWVKTTSNDAARTERGRPHLQRCCTIGWRTGCARRLPIGSFRQTNGCVLISGVLRRAPLNRLGDLGSFGR
jgi:hypothetical protein